MSISLPCYDPHASQLTLQQLTPRSYYACRELGVEPKSLLVKDIRQYQTSTTNSSSIECGELAEFRRYVPDYAQRQWEYHETRRQKLLGEVLHAREQVHIPNPQTLTLTHPHPTPASQADCIPVCPPSPSPSSPSTHTTQHKQLVRLQHALQQQIRHTYEQQQAREDIATDQERASQQRAAAIQARLARNPDRRHHQHHHTSVPNGCGSRSRSQAFNELETPTPQTTLSPRPVTCPSQQRSSSPPSKQRSPRAVVRSRLSTADGAGSIGVTGLSSHAQHARDVAEAQHAIVMQKHELANINRQHAQQERLRKADQHMDKRMQKSEYIRHVRATATQRQEQRRIEAQAKAADAAQRLQRLQQRREQEEQQRKLVASARHGHAQHTQQLAEERLLANIQRIETKQKHMEHTTLRAKE